MSYVAERGHLDAIKALITSGTSADAKTTHSSGYQPRERETPLTLADRNGHVKVFTALVDAGTRVNVRSGGGSETPLIPVARCDYFVGVQSLISHEGRIRFEDVAVHEVPLLPGTLKTMEMMCEANTFEFEACRLPCCGECDPSATSCSNSPKTFKTSR